MDCSWLSRPSRHTPAGLQLARQSKCAHTWWTAAGQADQAGTHLVDCSWLGTPSRHTPAGLQLTRQTKHTYTWWTAAGYADQAHIHLVDCSWPGRPSRHTHGGLQLARQTKQTPDGLQLARQTKHTYLVDCSWLGRPSSHLVDCSWLGRQSTHTWCTLAGKSKEAFTWWTAVASPTAEVGRTHFELQQPGYAHWTAETAVLKTGKETTFNSALLQQEIHLNPPTFMTAFADRLANGPLCLLLPGPAEQSSHCSSPPPPADLSALLTTGATGHESPQPPHSSQNKELKLSDAHIGSTHEKI